MKKILFILSFVLLFSSGCQSSVVNNTPPPVDCTQEAKLCPDGSYVGRTGSNCEFSACPPEKATSSTPPVTPPTSTLQFAFPTAAGAYCPNGQACPMYFLQITPGNYPIKIINANGTSNSVTFTVTSALGSQVIITPRHGKL